MAQFDMRGQKITGNQYIAGRDMNFGAVQSQADLVTELEKLKDEFVKAVDQGILSEEAGTDAEYQVTKAVQQAKKPDPDKKSILDHLKNTKIVLENVATAGTLLTSVVNAILAVQKLF